MSRICYYELLEVAQDAPQDQIKKAYFKQSLKYHPDKNKSEDAKEKFQQINEAYECLADANERTWYDNHRQQILSGKDKLDQDEIDQASFGTIKIKNFFNEKAYEGFENDANGFFAVYRTLFENLKQQEEKAYSQEQNEGDFVKLPGFGDINANPIQVHEFYEKWRIFESYKSFKWADQYFEQEEDRFYKRQIEKENKKCRAQEKAKYTKTLKALVEFVFKRDPRYQKYEEYMKEEKQRIYTQKKQEKDEKDKQFKELQDKQRKEHEEEQKIQREIELQKEKEEYEKKKQIELEAQQLLKKNAKFLCNHCDMIFETNKQQFNHNNSDKHKKRLKDQGKLSGQVEGTWLDKIKEKKQQI